MKTCADFFYILLFLALVCGRTQAEQVDQELLNSLKIEANHNLTRLKSLQTEKKNNKIFDDEREKTLGLFLEEQENWDLQLERGLIEYRKQKKSLSPIENGPEHRLDQKEKKVEIEKAEESREVQVSTRNKILSENPGVVLQLENEELGLTKERPRYDLRKRGKNKWVKNGVGSNTGPKASSASDYDNSFPPPPPADYVSPPPPMENYEDIPLPPPPNYDYGAGFNNANPYEAGYGDIPPPPPPPPIDNNDF